MSRGVDVDIEIQAALQRFSSALGELIAVSVEKANFLAGKKTVIELSARFNLLSDVLGTILNFLRTEENAFSSLMSLKGWVELQTEEEEEATLEQVRRRVRSFLIPSVETMTQDLLSGHQAAGKIGSFVLTHLEGLEEFIETTKNINLKFLELIELHPESHHNLLDAALSQLYKGDIQSFEEIVGRLRANARSARDKLE